MKPKNKDTILSIISDPLTFVSKRFPNIDESTTISASQAAIDTFVFGDIKPLFGENPQTSALLRDMAKLPGVYSNVINNNTLAYTDTKYDEGALWSHTIKVVGKTSFVLAGYFYGNLETAARVGNIFWEFPNRFFSIATREKQSIEKANPEAPQKGFWQFILEDTESSWLKEAAGEASIKSITADLIGQAVKYVGYIKYGYQSMIYLDHQIVKFLGGTIKDNLAFKPEDGLYTKLGKTTAMLGYLAPAGITLIIATDLQIRHLIEKANANFMGTSVRVMQDFTGAVVRDIQDPNERDKILKAFNPTNIFKVLESNANNIVNKVIDIIQNPHETYKTVQDTISSHKGYIYESALGLIFPYQDYIINPFIEHVYNPAKDVIVDYIYPQELELPKEPVFTDEL